MEQLINNIINNIQADDPEIRLQTVAMLRYLISGNIHLLMCAAQADPAAHIQDAAVTALGELKALLNGEV